MKEKIFTARQLIDELRKLNERMYEEVLDIISDHYSIDLPSNQYYSWDETPEGHLLLVLEDGEE